MDVSGSFRRRLETIRNSFVLMARYQQVTTVQSLDDSQPEIEYEDTDMDQITL